MKTVFIAGGTGLIGKRLSQLLSGDFQVYILSRRPLPENGNIKSLVWKPEEGVIEAGSLKPDIIINLAGTGIADQRWSAKRKNEIIQSRTQATLCINTWLQTINHVPDIYLGASAIGYYGDRAMELLDEKSSPGSGFLSTSVKLWESAHSTISAKKKAIIRIGVVLSTRGGALPKMLMTVKWLRLLSYFGSGQQMVSWIHIDDLCQVFLKTIQQDRLSGIINAVSPQPVDNKTMTRQIAEVLPFFTWTAPAPAFLLKMVLGEMSHVVLDSARVFPVVLLENGFDFKFPSFKEAFNDLWSHKI
ncbi:MAG: TIGR01777 family protein [Saprospiraceae bacterium]|nr:TIGR01777 family protein [Saprospiraceae bacterium]MBK8849283.1 TIGR01777 family protein [Saprospiraceae bacterium]